MKTNLPFLRIIISISAVFGWCVIAHADDRDDFLAKFEEYLSRVELGSFSGLPEAGREKMKLEADALAIELIADENAIKYFVWASKHHPNQSLRSGVFVFFRLRELESAEVVSAARELIDNADLNEQRPAALVSAIRYIADYGGLVDLPRLERMHSHFNPGVSVYKSAIKKIQERENRQSVDETDSIKNQPKVKHRDEVSKALVNHKLIVGIVIIIFGGRLLLRWWNSSRPSP